MRLKVITQDKGLELDREVCLVEGDGIDGQFGILEGHIDFVTSIKADGAIRYQTQKDSPIKELRLSQGLLEVINSKDHKTEIRVLSASILEK
ncbi:MAG: hypothetical protein SFT81_02340 [Candidatus Caenarcaniphilales bacterium]|nr:hypothetical protein [Candidatus Caenarcaniphilales bacterium]